MQIITYIIVGVILMSLDCILYKNDDNKKISIITRKLVFFIVLFNILSVWLFRCFVKHPNAVLPYAYHKVLFCIEYIAFALFLGVIFFFFKGIFNSKISFSKIETEKMAPKQLISKIVLAILFTIGSIFWFFSNWFIKTFGEMTPEQFLFNFKSPIKGTSSGFTNQIISAPVFYIIVSLTLFLFFINFKYNVFTTNKKTNEKKQIISKKIIKTISLWVAIVFFVGGVSYGSIRLQLPKIAKMYFYDSSFFADNYVDPRNVKMSFPQKKRNLIHIYLESVENSYLSKELGGYMNVNLMPELTQLSKEGISFSNNNKFGGPYQMYGSSWSVASMVNMGCGVPLKVPMGRNSYGKEGNFLPGIINIGDILEAEGYNQTIMFGADADFGGLTTYFTQHGNFNIFDYKRAKKEKLIPKDYKVWWGYEDDKLYNYAQNELTRLYKAGKPFNFTMETADTHFPDGYMSKYAQKKYPSQYANVIAYSTKETVKFVKWIQKQPFYDNTTIVITGDHLSMDKNFFKNFDKSYHRTIFNLILNPAVTTTNVKNRKYAPFDMFPTILESMGVKIQGDRLGLGTSLFANKPTLIEKKGVENVEKGLEANSNFFNDKFISPTQNSIFKTTLVTQRKDNK